MSAVTRVRKPHPRVNRNSLAQFLRTRLRVVWSPDRTYIRKLYGELPTRRAKGRP